MRNGTTSGQINYSTVTYSKPTNTVSRSFGKANGFQVDVTSAAITQGNFRDPNNWSYSIRDIRHETGYENVNYSNGSYSRRLGGSGTGSFPQLAPTAMTDAYNEAIDKAYGRIYGSLNLAVDVAEFGSTARMFNACDQAEQLFGRKASLLRKAGSVWLQYAYGWKPLASTIYDAATESQNRVRNQTRTVKGKSTKTDEHLVKDKSGPNNTIVTGQTQNRVTVVVEYDEGHIPNVARWTSLNPASIAWELVPFSFVIDWFYDIGGYMQSFERAILTHGAFRRGYVSKLSVQKLKQERFASYAIGGDKYEYYYSSSRRLVSFSRTKLTAPPLPRPPVLNTSLSSGRLLNAAALLSQLLK